MLDNLDCRVNSIYIKLENESDRKNVNYDIFYSDETTVSRYLASKTYNENVDKTKYSSIELSREC